MNNLKIRGILTLKRIFTLFLILIFSLTSCEQAFYLVDEVGSLEGVGDLTAPFPVLSLSPATASVVIGNTQIFTVSGGTPPYSYSIENAIGGSNISGSGLYTATVTPGTEDVRVTDAEGTHVDAVVTVTAVGVANYNTVTVYNAGGTQKSGAISGNFTFTNNGTANGVADVSWEVYVSSNGTIGAGDALIETGTTAALNMAETSGAINFTGTWPDQAATYNLIVRISSSDDSNASDNTGLIPVVVGNPNVDYHSSVVPAGGSSHLTGTAITESFTIENQGTDNGSADLFWSAYLSSDATLDIGADSIFDSGILPGGLNSSATSVVNVTGSWPSLAGDYYLILSLSAADDTDTGNDASASTMVFTITLPLSITPSSVSLLTGEGVSFAASGGTPPYTYSLLSGNGTVNSTTGVYSAPGASDNDVVRVTDSLTNTADAAITVIAVSSNVDYGAVSVNNTGGTLGSGPLTGTFTFTNGGTVNGSQAVNWEVYVSADNLIGAGDELIDSNSTAALNASQVSGPIAFSGTWPNIGATYNLIVKVSAADDTSTVDNTGLTSIVVSDPDVNYWVSSVTAANTPSVGGSAISETFYVQNIGASHGSQTVFWTAYTSTDNILDGSDVLIDSGQTSELNAAGSVGPLNIDSGSWPSVGEVTSYYLIVSLSSSDEIPANTGNNATASLPFSITKPDIDYLVNSVSNNNTPANVSTAVNETFTYRNNGSNNGTASVLWTAYASRDQELDGSDQILSSGSVSALAAGNTSGNITIDGNWSATGGSYYILVGLTSSDETNVTNNFSASGLFTILTSTAEPDYVVDSITRNYPLVTTDSIISETFIIRNASATAGSQQVSCDIFISTDDVFGSDVWIGNVTTSSLGAGGVSGNIPINIAWPSSGTYYLFIQLSATDEIIETANNISHGGTITVKDPPDYQVSFDEATVRVTGQTNQNFFGTPNIRIQNLTANDGQTAISYKIYRSADPVLDGGDQEIFTNSIGSLSGGASTLLPFTGSWPAETGLYYLIVTISADDDENSANDMSQYVVAVADTVVLETESNDSFANGGGNGWDAESHTGVTLGAGQSVAVEGLMDGFGGYDVIGFDTGTINAAKSISYVLGWNTGYDDIDFYLYNDSDGTASVYSSADISIYSEPALIASILPFPDFSTYYVAVNFWLANNSSGSTGKPYGLIIYANP